MTIWPELDPFVPMPKPAIHLVRFDDEPSAERRPVFLKGYSFSAGTPLRVMVDERWIPAEAVRTEQAAVIVRRLQPMR